MLFHSEINFMPEKKSIDIYELIPKYFNEEELRDLCSKLGIDYESLPAQGKASKARELIHYCGRHQMLTQLVKLCREKRSHVDWPNKYDIDIPFLVKKSNSILSERAYLALIIAVVLVVILISSGITIFGNENRVNSDNNIINILGNIWGNDTPTPTIEIPNALDTAIPLTNTSSPTPTVEPKDRQNTSTPQIIETIPMRTITPPRNIDETPTPSIASTRIEPTALTTENSPPTSTIVLVQLETSTSLPIATSTFSPTFTPIPTFTPSSTPTSTTTPTFTPTSTVTPTPIPTSTNIPTQSLGELLFTSNKVDEEYYQIYLVDLATNNIQELTNIGDGSNRHAVWSPDGQKIAFTSKRNGQDWDIYVMNADGSGPHTRLTFAIGKDTYPVWSPDGEKIAFVSERNGNDDIYVVNASGGVAISLTNDLGRDYHPDWSIDGRIIFSTSRDDTSGKDCYNELCDEEIYIMNDDGSNQMRLIMRVGTAEQTPDWSPDGKWIAFSSIALNNGDSDLYKIRPDGSDIEKLTPGTNNIVDRRPDWSPDGKYLAYVSAPLGEDFDIFILDISNINNKMPLGFLNHPIANDDQPYWKPVP